MVLFYFLSVQVDQDSVLGCLDPADGQILLGLSQALALGYIECFLWELVDLDASILRFSLELLLALLHVEEHLGGTRVW